MSWRHDAACQGRDPELFFPIGETGPALTQLAEAQKVCASCPVQCLCLEWAVLHGIDHGVWGGTSETDRRARRRRTISRRTVTPRTASRQPVTPTTVAAGPASERASAAVASGAP